MKIDKKTEALVQSPEPSSGFVQWDWTLFAAGAAVGVVSRVTVRSVAAITEFVGGK